MSNKAKFWLCNRYIYTIILFNILLGYCFNGSNATANIIIFFVGFVAFVLVMMSAETYRPTASERLIRIKVMKYCDGFDMGDILE